MEKVLQVLNRMQADGVIERFAIGGGIAAYSLFGTLSDRRHRRLHITSGHR